MFYIIRANIEGRELVVKRAYSEFADLDRELTTIGLRSRDVRLPSKGTFGVRSAFSKTSHKEKLQLRLERYLDRHLQLGGPRVADLFGLTKHAL